ncbi:MAG: cation diffusion facilitator family transporter [Victivallaceae bacterium]|nr:cation diffusion facilitator family transporter [Victivallaceae bacterium]
MSISTAKLAAISGYSSIFGNVILAAFKMYVALISNSSAIMADAFHTLSDSVTSVIFLAGIKFSDREPDRQHPFGHGRYELIAAVVIGVLLAVVAFDFGMQGFHRLIDHQPAEYGPLAYWAMILTIVIKEGMAQFAFMVSRRTCMTSLKADGIHHRTDALSSLVILVGLIAGSRFWWLDGVLSILVALMILWSAVEVLRSAISPLLGEEPTPELTEQVTCLCRTLSGRRVEAHHFHLHRYGSHCELTFHIRLPGDWPLDTAHTIAENIQDAVRNSLKIEATIHVEPDRKELSSSEVEPTK